MSEVIFTTGASVEGRNILSYLGIVSGETIMGADLIKDIFANYTDAVGGRSGVYEREFARARSLALESLQKKARAKGANAVVGLRFDHLTLGANNGMMMVAVCGTAVLVSGLSAASEAPILEKRFFIRIKESEKGPFTKAQLLELYSRNNIDDETACRLDGSEAWSTVRTLVQE
jgi:uncharacterized protein YbjQ (UPF0145 family)